MGEVVSRTDNIAVRLADDSEKQFSGRAGWALRRLIAAGSAGVTTIDLPAGVRWSHYVFLLRKEGVVIRMHRETHGGQFGGTHGRYTLAAPVQVISDDMIGGRAA